MKLADQKKVAALNGQEKALFNTFNKLKRHKNDSVDYIIAKVKNKVKKYDLIKDIGIKKRFKSEKEKKRAKLLLLKYLDDYEVVTISDKRILSDLIYLEILNIRLQEKLNKIGENDNAIPSTLIRTIHDNLGVVSDLKEKLGISGKKEDSAFKAYQTLKKKAKIWRKNNQASRQLACPHCGKIILLKMRMDAWKAQKHPYFKDKILGSLPLIKLYLQKKITKKDVANVLETTQDYVSHLIEKWKTMEEYQQMERELKK